MGIGHQPGRYHASSASKADYTEGGLCLRGFPGILLSGMRGVAALVAMLELAVALVTLACKLPIRDPAPTTLARDLRHTTLPTMECAV